jgi:hypothetical protein
MEGWPFFEKNEDKIYWNKKETFSKFECRYVSSILLKLDFYVQ